MKKLLFIITTIFVSAPLLAQQKSDLERTYGIAIIWIKDQAKWEEYGKKSDPIVEQYGGGIERSIEVQGYQGGDFPSKSDLVNITYMKSPQAQQAMMQDVDFQKLMGLRQEAIDVIFIGGLSINNYHLNNGKLEERIYSVELAYYDDGGAYDVYMKVMQGQFGKYGFVMEREIQPQSAYGIEAPKALNIMYYKNMNSVHKARHDSRYASIQNEIYPSVVTKSIWFSGKLK